MVTSSPAVSSDEMDRKLLKEAFGCFQGVIDRLRLVTLENHQLENKLSRSTMNNRFRRTLSRSDVEIDGNKIRGSFAPSVPTSDRLLAQSSSAENGRHMLQHMKSGISFSDPGPLERLGQFPIWKKSSVYYGRDVAELPPLYIVAAAASDQCCKIVGKLYWVPRPSTYGYTVQGRTLRFPEQWFRVPHLVYVREPWTPSQKQRWDALRPSEKVRELDAFGGRLPMSVPVMPITLDFTGELYRDDDNAVRTSGHLRGRAEPLAALCIHNKAYLGWVEDLVERHSHPKSKDFLRGGDGCSRASEGATDAFVVKGARRDNAEMVDWDHLVSRLGQMHDEFKDGAIVPLRTVQKWVIAAEDATRTQRADAEQQTLQEDKAHEDVDEDSLENTDADE